MNEIDIVIPWVDDSDPKWLAEYQQYKPDRNSDGSSARYRDWDVFKYWFRSIEMYAPWVRKIHFVTYGHLPSWLNVRHPKLHIVTHTDFIPAEYLPTFSSHTIELNLHRIPDLAEHFIYFNDDVYLAQPTVPTDFFKKGKPVDAAIYGVIKNSDDTNYMPYIMLNMMALINMEFDKRSVMKRNFWKWFSPKYGKGVLKNAYLAPWSIYTGFMNYHTSNPFCKSTFQKVWAKYPGVLDQTCRHKFRSKEDVNQYLMRYWQLCEGNFEPHKPNSTYVTIGNETMTEIEKDLYQANYQVVCINDDPMGFDFASEQRQLKALMERKYPNKSSFEI